MCSYHSIQRAYERTQFKKSAVPRFVEKGIERGKTADDFNQDEKKYLENQSRDNCTAKAYNGYCLIISDQGNCVTLYRLPEWFGKKRFYNGKDRIRNVKHYAAGSAGV